MERYSVAIKELPSEERPRERLIRNGPQALSTAELLAIVLRVGTKGQSAVAMAENLLSRYEGLRGVACASVAELARMKGVGQVKGVQIAACVELGRRLAANTGNPKPIVRVPEDAVNLLMPEMRDAAKEQFRVVMLNTKNVVIKIAIVSIGSLDSSIVHPREVFRDAITEGSASVILAHNHPSGDPAPSVDDRQVTKRLTEAGQLIGIEVLDHLVIGDGRWVSMKQQGYM